MRYEDASQTGSMTSEVAARDDTDHLAGNDFGPATGNLITGSGTVSGSAGVDVAGPGAHITAIAGAGGSDNSFDANGKLEVAGQYGTLTIDAEGNYTYARNPGSPEGVSDTFTYTLANAAGAADSAQLIIAIGNPPILQAQGTQTVRTADGVVVLPPGVELSDVRVVGRDLVITLPDGSTMVIPDGAIFVPQLVVNGVEVPASNLAALLIDAEPKPAAGDSSPNQLSSGGNFALPPPPLDPGVPLGDLLPPTELVYTPPQFEEIAEELDPNDPPLIGSSSVNISEEGVSAIALPNPDTSGSPDTTNSASNTGVLPVSDPDGDPLIVTLSTVGLPTNLTSHGLTIAWSLSPDGHTLTGSAGGLPVITLVINNAGNYTATLLRPIDHPNAGGEQGTSFVVAVSVTDGEDTNAGGSITVTIEDDSPTIEGRVSEPILITDDTTFNINDVEAIGGAFSISYGADGAHPTTPIGYSLSINAGATGLFDTLSGQQVVLTLVGGVVIGTAGAGGPEVFRVSIDGSGNVTLDQSRAVVHNDPNDPLETNASGSAATLASDNLIVVNVTAIDYDGDSAAIPVNIGLNLRFEDDGPSVTPTSASEPILVVDDTTLGTNASASFAGLFNPVFGNDGPGAGGGIAYALSITAGASGIIDVATGQAVNLVMNGSVVEGRTSGSNDLVFTISVNGSGVVTLDQIRAVQHNDPADHDEPGASAATLSADNLVKLTITVTDGDNDSVTATVNIGQNLQFKDDGPSVTISTATEPVLVVDDTTLGTNASASFAGMFLPVFGADGAGPGGGIAYALSITAGPSGIVDVATGQAVNLVMNGAVVEGRTAGSNDLVFTISVDASGVVTLDQIRAVQHNDPADHDEPGASAATLTLDTLVKLTATVTDKDGDSATAILNIGQNMQFKDDGPSVSISSATEPVLVVDDTTLATNASASFAALFVPNFGADGQAAVNPITYGLSITAGPSGIIDVATGEAVNLVMNGSVVEGRTAGSNLLVFTISVDASGVVTLDQIRAVQHNDPADHDEPGASAATLSADSLVKLTATVTDKDGDTATASVDIGQNFQFKDDGPSASVNGSITEPVLVVDDTTLNVNASASFAGLFNTAFGNDGPAAGGGIGYALSITAGPSGIIDVATGEAVNLVMNGNVVEGRTAGSNLLVFTISVDGSGLVTLDQVRAVQHNDPADPDEPGGSAATLSADSLVKLTATVTDKDADTATAVINIGQNFQFKDDGPNASPSGSEPVLVVDDTTLGTNASAGFAGLFSGAFGNDGPAGGGGITYNLTITPGPSGIIDVATGEAVNLVMNGSVVEGRTAGTNLLVFTVSVDASGVVTLDQIRAVQHNDPADHDEPGASAATLSADGLIKLTAVLTDKDGDTATVAFDIGQNLQFKDDGPSVTISTATEPVLVVDDTTLATNASASFAGMFLPVFGADGAGPGGGIAYALSITAGPSGIIDVATGQAVNLVMNGAVVEGRTAVSNDLVFTISVSATGVVTLDQIRAVQHNDPADHDEPGASAATLSLDTLVKLTATVTDKDGDSATAVVNIGQNMQFKDDGPSVSISSATEPVLVVDDTTLATNASASFAGMFLPVFGADGAGPGGGVSYALAITAGPSGIIDVATGQAVNLVMNGAVVEGRTAGSNELVFTISVDGSGVVTLDQIRAVQHNDPADHDEPGASAATLSADSLVKLTATVTDKDGDTATATVNIGQNLQFKDDGPSAVASGSEPVLVVDDTTLGTNASASFASLFLGSFGNDGPATGGGITYALSITAGPSGIIDVATGEAVNLVLNGSVVEGRTAGTNLLVFTVSVDSNGLVTLDQVRAVQHNDPADHDEPGASAATLTADSLIKLNVTITDKDGDTATASVNIGQNLQFKDDGPSVTISTATEPVLVVDDTTLGTNASASFAGMFLPVFGADGAGPGGGIAYALSITAGPSGIIDVATGQAVNLVMNGSVVEGRTSGSNDLVFTISVNGSGVVTLDQIRAVQHNDPADHDEPGASAATLTLDTLVKLTATVTDKDGDSATAILNIGQNMQFKDDGPSVTISTATEPVLVVDDTTLGTNASASFAGMFLPVFGADGAGPGGGIAYALSITAGPSGIIDVATGQAVNLVMNGAVVEGRTAGSNDLVFTISVDASGVVTLDQIRAVQHNDPADHDEPGASAATLSLDTLVKLTATVTDKDGDSATAVVNIGQNMQFKDDGPSVSISTATEPVLVVDDTTLTTNASASFAGMFLPVFGADGAGPSGGVTYALSIIAGASGVIDVATGHAVNLVMNGSVVEGRTAGSNHLVFTISVDASGVVTLDQLRAVQHNDPADPDEPGGSAVTLTADNLVKLTATVTDKDGDTATAIVNIGQNFQFKDDGPGAFDPTDAVVTNSAGPASSPIALNFAVNSGADGVGDVVFDPNINGDPVMDTLGNVLTLNGGEELVWVLTNGGHTLEGRGETTNTLAITVTLNPSGDSYTVDLDGSLFNIDPVSFEDVGGVGGGNVNYKALGTDTPLITQDILISGNGSVNTNSTEIGIATGNDMGTGDVARFDMLENITVVPAAPANGNTGFDHDGHYEVGQYAQKISFVQGGGNNTSGFTVTILTGDDDFTYIGDATGENPTSDITVEVWSTDPELGGAVLLATFTDTDNSVVVTGVKQDNWIVVKSSDQFSIVQYSDQTGRPYKLGEIRVETANTLDPFDIQLPIIATDKDGDPVTSTIDITLNPPAPPVVLDLDGDGVEFLSHDAGVQYNYGAGLVGTAWAGADDGILVRDANGNGLVDDASEFVFGGIGQTDMEALHAQYGAQLDASDADFTMFAIWNDANSNGVVDGSELQSLAEAGIASIGLVSDGVAYSAANGDVQVAGTASYTRTDGSTGDAADAIFGTGSAKSTQEVERVAANSNSVALAAAVAAAGIVAAAPAAAQDFGDAETAGLTNAVVSRQAFADAGFSALQNSQPFEIGGGWDASFTSSFQPLTSSSYTAIASSHVGQLTSELSLGSGVNPLLDATDLSALMPMPAMSTGMEVAMPSAEALIGAMSAVNAQTTGAVEQILADALMGGGSGPDINGLLNALPGAGLGELSTLPGLASPVGEGVPGLNSGHSGVFTFDAATIMTSEAMVLHHDAIQPVANG